MLLAVHVIANRMICRLSGEKFVRLCTGQMAEYGRAFAGSLCGRNSREPQKRSWPGTAGCV